MGFQDVRRIYVPRRLAVDAHTHLQKIGMQHLEAFALWAGVQEGEAFHVRQAILPKQIGYSSLDGVCVVVEGEELHRINVWLFKHEMTLISQLHSHPSEAYHSGTDDSFPIATTLGSLSLVVPDFAQAPFDLLNYVTYRLMEDGQWIQLSQSEGCELVRILD